MHPTVCTVLLQSQTLHSTTSDVQEPRRVCYRLGLDTGGQLSKCETTKAYPRLCDEWQLVGAVQLEFKQLRQEVEAA